MASSSTTAPPLGPLIRLLPLTLTELPSHPTFTTHEPAAIPASQTTPPSTTTPPTSRPSLPTFLHAILSEASTFIGATVPSTFKASGMTKSKPSTSDVQILKRTISAQEVTEALKGPDGKSVRSGGGAGAEERKKVLEEGENWFVRKSVHESRAQEGTADWREFDAGLRVEHNENERAYTPDLYDAFRVVDWDRETEALGRGGVPGYEGVQMRIYEMCHKLPPPLAPRAFPVLVVSALEGKEGGGGEPRTGIVVHLPVDLAGFPLAMYSNGRNVTEGDDKTKRKKVVLGTYTSIERITMVEGNKVEWMMGVASDVSGALPMWAQKMGMPGAIAKDVGLFFKWVADNRKSSSEREQLAERSEAMQSADVQQTVDAPQETGAEQPAV